MAAGRIAAEKAVCDMVWLARRAALPVYAHATCAGLLCLSRMFVFTGRKQR